MVFLMMQAILGSDFYIMEKVEGIILNYKEAKKRDIAAKTIIRLQILG